MDHDALRLRDAAPIRRHSTRSVPIACALAPAARLEEVTIDLSPPRRSCGSGSGHADVLLVGRGRRSSRRGQQRDVGRPAARLRLPLLLVAATASAPSVTAL
jgi:hypothetical protein